MSATQPDSSALDALLDPKSVAVIGASDSPTRIGGRPVAYLLRAGFPGPIWPVNPNRETVQGLRAYPSIADVPDAPDAVIVAVSAPLVPATLEACADRGAKAAVILSAGFAEAGEEGAAAQRRVSDIARERGMRVLGPNTLGLFNAHTRWMGTFASTVRYGTPEPGPIGVASQSGAVGSELFNLLRRRGLDTGIWITTGNESDVDLADAVAYLADHADTEIIAVYAEGVRDGPGMVAALARASEVGKPVLFLKSGKSDVGAQAVLAHTAAQAGSDRIYDALFEQLGVVRVRSAEELVDAAYATARTPLPAGRRLLILTISGGAGVQMADAAVELGLAVDPPSAEAQEKLKALVPFAGVGNPVDTTAQVFNDIGLIGEYLRILLDDADYDVVTLFLTSVAASEDVARAVVAELGQAMSAFPDVALIVSLTAPPELARPYVDAGYPVFEEPTRAVQAASVLCRLRESRDRGPVTLAVEPPAEAVRVPEGMLRGRDAMELLESWGVSGIDRADSRSGDGADVAPLESDHAVEAVEAVEVVVGIDRDPTFGPVVRVALGGRLGEVLDDVVFRLAPFDASEARRMITELRGSRALEASRGNLARDVDALAELLRRLSVFGAVEGDVISTVELVVRVLPAGQGIAVADAVIGGEARDAMSA